ncbi:MAG: hypothetical protein ACRETG_05195 [Steroidobacteraceae bacterium]
MGRFCILCSRVRPSEAFGGKGERARICQQCRALPAAKRDALKHEREILGFLEQSHVSDKNIRRLRALTSSGDSRISSLAAVVLNVSVVTPFRRRRIHTLARKHRDLLKRMEQSGLIAPAALRDSPEPLVRSAPTWDEWVEYVQAWGDE